MSSWTAVPCIPESSRWGTRTCRANPCRVGANWPGLRIRFIASFSDICAVLPFLGGEMKAESRGWSTSCLHWESSWRTCLKAPGRSCTCWRRAWRRISGRWESSLSTGTLVYIYIDINIITQLTRSIYLALAYRACDPWAEDPTAAMGLKAELWLNVGRDRESSSCGTKNNLSNHHVMYERGTVVLI